MDLKIPSYLLQHVPVGYAYGYFLNHLKLQWDISLNVLPLVINNICLET